MSGKGRPTTYTQEQADKLCALIAEGNSLRKAAEITGIQTATIYSWFRIHEDFVEQYARAKEDSGDADQDKLDEIAEKVIAGELDPQAARVAADIIKWSASKKKPRKYGDRIQQEISGSLDLGQLSDDQLDAKIAAYLSKEANK